MRLLRFALKRAVLLLAMLPLLVLFLVILANGSPEMDALLRQQAGQEAWDSCRTDPECTELVGLDMLAEVERRRVEILALKLSQPPMARVLSQTVDFLTLDWGTSLYLKSAGGSSQVTDIILERLPWTVGLFASGTALAAAVGVRLGLRMATRAGSKQDYALTGFSMSTIVIPSWIWGVILLTLFAIRLRIFPLGGRVSLFLPRDPLTLAVDLLWHMGLPLLTLVLSSVGAWAYATRGIALQVADEDFITAARARGLSEGAVRRKHLFRAVAPPVLTTLLLALIAAWNASILLEGVFNWPGTGRLYWEALGLYEMLPGDPGIGPFDFPVLISLAIVYAAFILATIFILEVAYRYLDPRIQSLDVR